MTITDLARAILNGDFDANLDVITKVIKERREAQARVTFFSLRPGDKVRFRDGVRPAYLAGATGTLRDLRRSKVTVDLDKPAGRFNRGIVTPVTLIEKVS